MIGSYKDDTRIREIFERERDAGGKFFVNVGLPRNVSLKRFRKRYESFGKPDVRRLEADLLRFRPSSKEATAHVDNVIPFGPQR